MKFNFSPETQEAIKEFGRVIVLAIIPVLIDSISIGYFSLRVTGVALLLAILRATDKYLHEKGSKYQLPF